MLGLPKGSLEESTIALFGKAGWKITKSSRSYKPSIDDPELDGRFVRAQEISRYVEQGFFDCGLTGYDWIIENNSDVVEVCDLVYSKATALKSRWVLCVKEDSPVKTVKDLQGKRIATELVNVTKKYLADNGVKADVEFSWGATEVKVPDLVGRNRRHHRNGVVASRKQFAHRRYDALYKHEAYRQQGGLGKPRQTRQDRIGCALVAGGFGRGDKGRFEDEFAESQHQQDYIRASGSPQADRIAAFRSRMGRGRNYCRRKDGARNRPDAQGKRSRRHCRISPQ